MKNLINHDENLKKHGEEGKSNLRTPKMFGIITDFNQKIEQSKATDIFLGHQTMKMLEDNQRESELQKAKAIEQISRLQTLLI